MVTMEYEETQETELSIEEIKDRLIELAEHNKEHKELEDFVWRKNIL